MESQGWIALPRNIIKSWLWENPRKLKMWLKLVMMANWEESSSMIGNTEVIIGRGQIIRSIPSLASELGCSKQTAQTFLEVLEKSALIKKEIERKTTKITILKYNEYSPLFNKKKNRIQYHEPGKDQTLISQKIGQNLGTYKEYKENNKEKISSSSNLREENLKIFDEIRKNDIFWEQTAMSLHVELPVLREKAEFFFLEMETTEDFKNTLREVKEHLFNWLRKSIEIEESKIKSNNFYNYNGKNTNNNRRGTEADTPRYRDGAEPKF